jgi:hypothetical protein
LAVLGSFGQIWAEFAAFTVAESMPELGLKSSKPHTIHIYSLKKFQKIQKFIAFTVACPKTQKPISVNNVL